MKTIEKRLVRAAPWLASAAIAAEIGWLEMARGAAICGLHDGPGHCAACYVAAALALTGLAVMMRRPRVVEAGAGFFSGRQRRA